MKANGHAKNGAGRELSVAEAARKIGCSPSSVYRLAAEKEIHGWRLSDRGWMKIDPVSVERFLSGRRRRNFAGGKK